MGAWIVLLTALRRPELVSRVVAVNGGPLRGETRDLDLLPKDREAARRLTAALRDPGSPPTPDAVLDDLVRRVASSQATRMLAEQEDLESHLLTDDRLAEIGTPVDLLWGESDRYLGRVYPERLLAGLPTVRRTWIARCGHVPQVECPQSFGEKLKEVLTLGALEVYEAGGHVQ
jgi:pimeloyl-ACP methyl ester carboxylesterase